MRLFGKGISPKSKLLIWILFFMFNRSSSYIQMTSTLGVKQRLYCFFVTNFA